MSVLEAVTQTVQALSPEQQQQVLEYAQALHQAKNLSSSDSHTNSFLDHPAFGIWKDREELNNVKEWRQQLWRRE